MLMITNKAMMAEFAWSEHTDSYENFIPLPIEDEDKDDDDDDNNVNSSE